jgi:phosphoribosylformylglycinamidine synthase
MEYLTSPGDACFTPSEAKKLTERINKLGVRVSEIRGVFLHYTHLRQSDRDFVKVSFLLYFLSENPFI